jgi:hypothetical protein
MILRENLQIRDPFVFTDADRYVLYGTTDANCWQGAAAGFEVYTSPDLEQFEPAGCAFSPRTDFWGLENFWAPEIHAWRGAYYLFASFKAPGRRRATAILRSNSPLGPFAPWGADQVTPRDWECLDGTLHVDEAGDPWLVFCHEWVQQPDGGTICALALQADLSGPIGLPIRLFAAADAPWPIRIRHSSGVEGYVTDGPFMVGAAGERLMMLWSSLSASGYALGLSVSDGGILGPWRHKAQPAFSGDGGHGMMFRDLAGDLRLAIHAPNETPLERPQFLYARDIPALSGCLSCL